MHRNPPADPSRPGVADLILNVIDLEYHETLMPGSGKQAEEQLQSAMTKYAGRRELALSAAPAAAAPLLGLGRSGDDRRRGSARMVPSSSTSRTLILIVCRPRSPRSRPRRDGRPRRREPRSEAAASR